MPLTDEVVDELIARAYEAGADPRQWPAFLEAYGQALGSRSCTLQVHELARPSGSIAFSHGEDPQLERDYAAYYGGINPWTVRGAPLMQPGRVLTGEMVLSASELKKTEFYDGFLRRADVMHSVVAVVARDGELGVFVAAQRSHRAGQYTATERRLVERLMPHLVRAIGVHRRLGALRLRDELLVDVAERATCAVMFLDERGRVVFANGLARAFDAPMTTRIVEAAARGGGSVLRPDGRPLIVSVTPATPVDPLGLQALPETLVLVVDPDAEAAPPIDLLCSTWGLTLAEARVAIAVSRGEAPEQIATATGTSVLTVRSHLRNVFAKTGTRRQAQLVRLVLLSRPRA